MALSRKMKCTSVVRERGRKRSCPPSSPPPFFCSVFPSHAAIFPFPLSLPPALLTSLIFIRLLPLSFRLMGELQEPLLSHPSTPRRLRFPQAVLIVFLSLTCAWERDGARWGEERDEMMRTRSQNCLIVSTAPPSLFPSLSREKNSKAPSKKKSLKSAAVPF